MKDPAPQCPGGSRILDFGPTPKSLCICCTEHQYTPQHIHPHLGISGWQHLHEGFSLHCATNKLHARQECIFHQVDSLPAPVDVYLRTPVGSEQRSQSSLMGSCLGRIAFLASPTVMKRLTITSSTLRPSWGQLVLRVKLWLCRSDLQGSEHSLTASQAKSCRPCQGASHLQQDVEPLTYFCSDRI